MRSKKNKVALLMQKSVIFLLFMLPFFGFSQINCGKFTPLYMQGITHFDSTEYEHAVSKFTKVINETSLAKCFNKAFYYRGSSYFYLGITDSAIADFEKYVLLEPQDELGLRKLGALYYYIGNNDLALTYYKAALDLAPEDVYTLYNMGEAFFQKGEFTSAEKMYRKAFNNDTTHYESLVGIAKVQAETELFDMSINNLDRAIRLNPGQYQAYFWKGIVYMRAPHMGKAETMFDLAEERDSSDANIYLNRAITHAFTFNYDKALNDYNKLLQIYPDSEDGLIGRAVILLEMEQFELAVSDLDECLALNKLNTDALFYRGYCQNKLEKYDLAADDFTSIIAIDKENFEAWYNLGIAHYSMNELEEAINDYSKAIAINNSDPDVYFNRGLVYDLRQEYQKAIDDYTQSVFYNSADPEAYFNRCVSKFMLGKKKDACEDCRMAEFYGKQNINPKLLKGCKKKKEK